MAKTKKPPPPPWETSVAEFKAYLELRRSAHTLKNYEHDLIEFRESYDRHNEVPLASAVDVTTADMVRYKRDLEGRPGRKYKGEEEAKQNTMPATINRKLSAVHSFLKWAAANGHIPGAAERPEMSERQKLGIRWLDEKEQTKLDKALELKRVKLHQALIRFDLYTGLRCAELAELRWSDITIKERSGVAHVRKGKGAKYREVPLGFEARAALGLLDPKANLGSHDKVFVGRQGPLTDRGIRFIVSGYAELARLPDLTTHVLRHTFAKNYLREGGTLEDLATILGHEDVNTTMIYVVPSIEELQSKVENMGRGKRRT